MLLPAAAEAEQAGEEGSESWSDKFSNLLTSTYGELQAAAGKAVGVPQGEAWRTALRAAARCGTAQVWCRACELLGVTCQQACEASECPVLLWGFSC